MTREATEAVVRAVRAVHAAQEAYGRTRRGPGPATEAQALAAADEAHRTSLAEFDAAMARVKLPYIWAGCS